MTNITTPFWNSRDKMEKHRNELLKICRVCQIQLTKPFYSLRLVISVDSLRNLIFPYDCNLYPTNVCQQCKRKVEKEVTRFQAFRKKWSINKLKKAETASVGEFYIDHIVGWIIFSKVVYFFTASCLSHYTILGEIPKKISGQSEVVKGSTKDSEISGQNTKEMAIISDINFFWP